MLLLRVWPFLVLLSYSFSLLRSRLPRDGPKIRIGQQIVELRGVLELVERVAILESSVNVVEGLAAIAQSLVGFRGKFENIGIIRRASQGRLGSSDGFFLEPFLRIERR